MVNQDKISVEKEISFPGSYVIRLLSDGIIEIDWDHNVEEVNINHLKQIKNAIKNFGNGKKMPIYITTFPFMNISIEARKFAASEEGQEFTLANAVLIDNLGVKLMFNFFIKINKPKTPTKAFKTRDQAIKWLQHLDKNQSVRSNP